MMPLVCQEKSITRRPIFFVSKPSTSFESFSGFELFLSPELAIFVLISGFTFVIPSLFE